MNKPFTIILSAYKEESSGQISELIRFAEKYGAKLVSHAELEGLKFEAMTSSSCSACVKENALLYMDKKNNANIVLAVRAALTFNAAGILIKFGVNPMRDYILNGDCYAAGEVGKGLNELIRLAPLFGRRLVFYAPKLV